MVGVNAYARVQINSPSGVGNVLEGDFNTASVIQDPGNINAGIIRVNFSVPFLFPPVVMIQPVRVGVEWAAPDPYMSPFMPDGSNVHRDVFPLPPPAVVNSEADEILDVPVARVHEDGALPDEGRPMPPSSRIEVENRLLSHRLLHVERTEFQVQFATYLGQVVRVRPFTLDGDAGADDLQQGIVNEILFGYVAAGDLNTSG